MSKEDEVSSAIFDLYDAIDLEDVETVKLILKSSSLNLNQSPAPRELTVLHLAVGLGSVEIVKLLLDYGADVSLVTQFMATSFQWLVRLWNPPHTL